MNASAKEVLDRYALILLGISQNFGQAVQPELCLLWAEMLDEEQVTPEELRLAAKDIMKQGMFKTLPPFGVILDAVKKRRGGLRPGGKEERRLLELEASADWEAMMDAATSGGYGDGRIPEHLSPTCKSVVRQLGGWRTVCYGWNIQDRLPFYRKDFIEQWMLISQSGLTDFSGESQHVRDVIEQANKRHGGMLSLEETFAALRSEQEKAVKASQRALEAQEGLPTRKSKQSLRNEICAHSVTGLISSGSGPQTPGKSMSLTSR